MAKTRRTIQGDGEGSANGIMFSMKFDGGLASDGELPARELASALQGWDRFLQLAYYSQEMHRLELPTPGTDICLEFHVRRISKSSLLVDATIYLGNAITQGIIGAVAYETVKKVWTWSGKLIKAHIKAKQDKKTLDGVVVDLERLAKSEGVRVSQNRENSEDFASAINAALDNATVPLDSSAAIEVLSLKGQPLDIVIDKNGREAIRRPFEPPTLDPDADSVIEAPVKFIRINKKTGKGLLSFIHPKDDSQFGQQRFQCEDKSIRRRANQYTGAFHEDSSLQLRMQRKAYEQSRHGHYWLIVGTATPDPEDQGLFGLNET